MNQQFEEEIYTSRWFELNFIERNLKTNICVGYFKKHTSTRSSMYLDCILGENHLLLFQ